MFQPSSLPSFAYTLSARVFKDPWVLRTAEPNLDDASRRQQLLWAANTARRACLLLGSIPAEVEYHRAHFLSDMRRELDEHVETAESHLRRYEFYSSNDLNMFALGRLLFEERRWVAGFEQIVYLLELVRGAECLMDAYIHKQLVFQGKRYCGLIAFC